MSQEKKISVKETVYKKNNELAEEIRTKMKNKGKLFFNIMGSIGAGKTLLLEDLAVKLSPQYRVFVINGDIERTRVHLLSS